jgi:hypothetical protein
MDSERRIKQIEKKLGADRTQIAINLSIHPPGACPKRQVLHEVVGLQPCQIKSCPECGHFCAI